MRRRGDEGGKGGNKGVLLLNALVFMKAVSESPAHSRPSEAKLATVRLKSLGSIFGNLGP